MFYLCTGNQTGRKGAPPSVRSLIRTKIKKVSNIQFLPDDEFKPVLEQGSTTNGQLQLMRNATFDYVPNKPRVRANSTLLRKAAHGRISATRDEAYQLTLKIFKREGLDVKEAPFTRGCGTD